MAKIISISLDNNTLEEIDNLKKSIGLAGRSETIRAGIKSLASEKKKNLSFKGKADAVVSLIHPHTKKINPIIHKHQSLIVTHLHNHIKKDKCLDIFVLKGEAIKIKEFVDKCKKEKGIDEVNLAVY